MNFTGERYLPSIQGAIKYEHLHRYALCMDFIKDKTVLDIASGEGYGSALLAEKAKFVFGVDIDLDSIEKSNTKYKEFPNLHFIHGACESIPIEENSIEVVTSFETIEHHEKHHEMLIEIKRVMKSDGILIISSPNREIYSDKFNSSNPFHVKELYLKELEELLNLYFKNVEIFGQRLITSSMISSLKRTSKTSYAAYIYNSGNLLHQVFNPDSPLYFVAICSDAKIGENSNIESIFLDNENDLYFESESELAKLRNELFNLKNQLKGSRLWKIRNAYLTFRNFLSKSK